MRSGTVTQSISEHDLSPVERLALGLPPLPDGAIAGLREANPVFAEFIEKSADHFYGAWKGGKSKSGGGSATPGIPATDGIDRHEDVPKKADAHSLTAFGSAAKGDRVVAVVALPGKKNGQSVRGRVTRRSADSITVNAGGTTHEFGKGTLRHMRITTHGPKSSITAWFLGKNPLPARESGYDPSFYAFLVALTEKSSDDHFYGAWRGGKAAQGGGPVGEDTMSMHMHDGKWDPERVSSVHEPYIADTMAGLPTSKSPTVYMTGGGSASGKTTGLIKNPKAGIPGTSKAAHIDADKAKEHIPEYKAGMKAGDRTIAGHVHEESSHMSKAAIAANVLAGHDVVYDSVGDSGIEKLGAKVAEMRKLGAGKVVASYATVPTEVAIARSDARALATGRYVPHDVIRANHRDVTRTALAAVNQGLFDKFDLWDTSGEAGKPLHVATATGTKLRVLNKTAWAGFLAKAELD